MPLKLNVGISQKTGLPNYGSLGASCQVEVELESGLVYHDREAFQSYVRDAYVACKQAVADELARHQATALAGNRCGNGHREAPAKSKPAALPADDPSPDQNSGAAGSNGDERIPATERQLSFLRQLASQIRGLGLRRLEAAALKTCGTPLAALTSPEASRLIDAMKEVRAGKLDVAALMEEPGS